jgi:hypothetical protein
VAIPISPPSPLGLRDRAHTNVPPHPQARVEIRGNALSEFLGKKPGEPDPVVTSLGARLNKQLMAKPQPNPNESMVNQSLTRLFARLTQSAFSGATSMALQRKFNK